MLFVLCVLLLIVLFRVCLLFCFWSAKDVVLMMGWRCCLCLLFVFYVLFCLCVGGCFVLLGCVLFWLSIDIVSAKQKMLINWWVGVVCFWCLFDFVRVFCVVVVCVVFWCLLHLRLLLLKKTSCVCVKLMGWCCLSCVVCFRWCLFLLCLIFCFC